MSIRPWLTSGKSRRTAAKKAHGKALADLRRAEEALEAAKVLEADLLVAADAARQVDERRRHALMQLKWERVERIDL